MDDDRCWNGVISHKNIVEVLFSNTDKIRLFQERKHGIDGEVGLKDSIVIVVTAVVIKGPDRA